MHIDCGKKLDHNKVLQGGGVGCAAAVGISEHVASKYRRSNNIHLARPQ